MNPEIQSLRVVIYACPETTTSGDPGWSGVAELQAELTNGGFETYVIKPGTHHATKGAAIEAARQTMAQDLLYIHPLMPSGKPQPTIPASACYL